MSMWISSPEKLFSQTRTFMIFKGRPWPEGFAAVLAREAQSVNVGFSMLSCMRIISRYLPTRYTPPLMPNTCIFNHIIYLLIKFINVFKVGTFHRYDFLNFDRAIFCFSNNFNCNAWILYPIFIDAVLFIFKLFMCKFFFIFFSLE